MTAAADFAAQDDDVQLAVLERRHGADRDRAELLARTRRFRAVWQELAEALNVDAAKVRSILEANRPTPPEGGQGYGPGAGPGGPRGGHPDGGRPGFDDSALIAALATGLNIDQATVKAAFEKLAAAHEADHGARENAFFAAVAKALGLDASAVQKAFEAARPAPPTPPAPAPGSGG